MQARAGLQGSANLRRATLVAALTALIAALPAAAAIRTGAVGAFEITHEVEVPGTQEEAFDAFTGDISGWWDRSFSEHPFKIILEPRPGGGFYELFDEQGNGAQHARVIFVQRGQRIRFTGAMGFSGYAMEMVHTVDFLPADDPQHTRVSLLVRAAGQLDPDWPEGIERVWKHFLDERFKLYMEALQAAREGEGQTQAPGEPQGEAQPPQP